MQATFPIRLILQGVRLRVQFAQCKEVESVSGSSAGVSEGRAPLVLGQRMLEVSGNG